MKHLRYFCKIEKDGDGFMVSFPDYPGVLSDGRTYEDALTNASSALSEIIEVAFDLGKPLPIIVDRSGEMGMIAVDIEIQE